MYFSYQRCEAKMIPLKFTLTVQQIIWTSCLLLHFGRGEITQHKFKAAVFEHAVIFPETQKEVVTREKALALMKRNLAVYEEQAAEAANKVSTLGRRGDGGHANFTAPVTYLPF